MRLLDRYLLRELLVPFGYCLAGFLIFFIAADLFGHMGDFQSQKLHGSDVVEYYFVGLPSLLAKYYLLPISLLLALLYALTNHSRHHEITAIRAAGISLFRLCMPYFAVGIVASLVLFLLNELVVPGSVEATEKIRNRRVPPPTPALPNNQMANFGFSNTREKRDWLANVYNTETGEMLRPMVRWVLEDGSSRWLSADRAAWTNGVWTFYRASEFNDDPGKAAYLVPLIFTNVLTMPGFIETPAEIKSELKLAEVLTPKYGHGTTRSEFPIKDILNYLRFHPNPKSSTASKLYTDLHGRFAFPWTCLVVVLIAIPFGAAQGRRNVFVGVASSLSICVSYFVIQQLGLMFGSIGWVTPWLGAWLPNLCFGVTGLFMTARVR
jgi:lipopolysaccharide export system permease protein